MQINTETDVPADYTHSYLNYRFMPFFIRLFGYTLLSLLTFGLFWPIAATLLTKYIGSLLVISGKRMQAKPDKTIFYAWLSFFAFNLAFVLAALYAYSNKLAWPITAALLVLLVLLLPFFYWRIIHATIVCFSFENSAETSAFNCSPCRFWRLFMPYFLLSIITLGLGWPYAFCKLLKNAAPYAAVNGLKLAFEGSATLIFKWLLTCLTVLVPLLLVLAYSTWTLNIDLTSSSSIIQILLSGLFDGFYIFLLALLAKGLRFSQRQNN